VVRLNDGTEAHLPLRGGFAACAEQGPACDDYVARLAVVLKAVHDGRPAVRKQRMRRYAQLSAALSASFAGGQCSCTGGDYTYLVFAPHGARCSYSAPERSIEVFGFATRDGSLVLQN